MQRLDHGDELKTAGIVLRVGYCAGLITLVSGGLLASSSWIGITLGQSLVGVPGRIFFLLLAAAVSFRTYQVLRYQHALDAFVSGKAIALLRAMAVMAMFVGGLAGIGLFLVKPIALFVFNKPGDSGIAYFITGTYLALASSIGWQGCLAFEISRWMGKAPQKAPARPAYGSKQDVIVAVFLAAVFLGAPHLRQATAPEPCGQNRIACVAAVKSDIRRMIAAPLNTAVHFSSTVSAVRMQVRSGSDVRWEAPESPFASLRASGYSPTTDASLPVHVKIAADESSEGVVLTVTVSDAQEETARLTVSFPRGTRIEPDHKDGVWILAEIPWTSDSSVKGAFEDGSGETFSLDRLFVFFRQAIGTDIEAREAKRRTSVPAILETQAAALAPGRSLEELVTSPNIDVGCGDSITVRRDESPRSYAESDRAGRLHLVDFAGAQADAPHTYAHYTDRFLCVDGAIWIIHQVPIEPIIVLRRYSAEGVLERFVESQLPVITADRRYATVDPKSVREEQDAIRFDYIEIEIGDGGRMPDKFLRRDTYRVPVGT